MLGNALEQMVQAGKLLFAAHRDRMVLVAVGTARRSKLGCALPSGTATSSSAELLSCTVTELCGGPEYGILDGNLGQMVSFQSTYKSTLRIEVPVWPEVQQGVLTANKAKRHPGSPKSTPPFPFVGNNIQGSSVRLTHPSKHDCCA